MYLFLPILIIFNAVYSESMKEKVQEWNTNSFEWRPEKSMLGDAEGKAPQGTHVGSVEALHWVWHDPCCLSCGVGWSQHGASWLWRPQVPCPSVKESSTDYGKSTSCPFPFPGVALRQSPVMLICSPQIFGMRSSRKLNPFDTIISASLALCSCGDWLVTPMLPTWLEQLLWGGIPGAGPCVGVCPSPAVRMGANVCRWAPPVKHAQGAIEEMTGERRIYWWWGISLSLSLSLSLSHTHTHTHTHTHI